eukprot:TRINITY_DN46466_c0_g1_i1.p1 TRINITY_DN46466_c0_g1~~TRINITY_DN46466_c0_g1_i1.p1  ORF type:complete len:663 (+),score=40.24 TRINITY_DN46466_c0_g1_i1:212-2200(+)
MHNLELEVELDVDINEERSPIQHVTYHPPREPSEPLRRDGTHICKKPSFVHSVGATSSRRSRLAFDWLLGTKSGVFFTVFLVGAVLLSSAASLVHQLGVVNSDGRFIGNNEEATSWKASLWLSWCLFFDPGTQTGLDLKNNHSVLLLALVVSVVGFIYNLTLIGVVIEVVRGTLSRWMRTRSRVWCSGHFVLLGWNDKTLHVVAELLHWMSVKRDWRSIVILADKPEPDMQCAVHTHLSRRKLPKRYVICRQGRPDDSNDLYRAGVEASHAVFLLSQELEDGGLVRQIVSLGELHTTNVYADIWDSEKAFALHTMHPSMEIINTRRMAARLLSLMAFAPHVGAFYMDLFKHLLVVEAPEEVVGKPFRDASRHFRAGLSGGVCIGLQSGRARQGRRLLSPPSSTEIRSGDSLLVLSSAVASVNPASGDIRFKSWDIVGGKVDAMISLPMLPAGSLFVVAGWPDSAATLFEMLGYYAPPFSVVHVLAEKPVQERKKELAQRGNSINIKITHHVGKRTGCSDLAKLPLDQARAVLVVAERQSCSRRYGAERRHEAIASDSECLLCTAMIAGICAGDANDLPALGFQGKIVCEVLNTGSEKMLQQYANVKPGCVFFRTNEWEASVLAFAAMQRDGFKACRQLLRSEMIAKKGFSCTGSPNSLDYHV